MTYVNTIKTNTQTYTTEQLQQMLANGAIDANSIQNISIYDVADNTTTQYKDENDNEKIGFFEGIKEIAIGGIKGICNGIKGIFTDEEGNFSLGKTLKTALTFGSCFIPGVGPIIATGLCTYGAIRGTAGVVKGIVSTAEATTAAGKRAALQSIGGNGVAAAASFVGLRGSIGALAKQAGVATEGGMISNLKGLASGEGTGIVGTAKNLAGNITKGTRNYYGSAWQTASGNTLQKFGQVAGQTAKDTAGNIVNAYQHTKDAIKEKTARFNKKQSGTTTETNTYEVKDLSEVSESVKKELIKNNGTYTDPKTGKTYELSEAANGAQADKVGITSKAKQTTTTTTIDKLKNTLNETQLQQLSEGHTVTTGNPSKGGQTSYKLNGDNVQVTTTKNTGVLQYKADEFTKNAMANGYQGLSTTGGNVKMAAGALASNATTSEAKRLEQQIPTASAQYATVNTKTGYEYTLEDYNPISSDELDKKYAQIMTQAGI